MLPHVLSSEACSLVPGEDRLAVTAEIELSEAGEPRSASFYRSRIRSDARLNYGEIDDAFAGRKRAPDLVAEPIELARKAAAALADRRSEGALQVSSAEPEFRFEDGDVVAAEAVEQTESHRLIEQLMVLTNERVAELEERKRAPTLYRVHEQPDPERIERLVPTAGRARDTDAGAAEAHLAQPGRRDRGRGQPAGGGGGGPPRPRPRGVYIAGAEIHDAGALQREQPRPRRPRQPRLRALHLTDPSLPRSDRPQGAARAGRRRRGAAPRRAHGRGGGALLRARARLLEGRARRRRRLRRVPLEQRAVRARPRDPLRRRGLGPGRRWRLRPLRRGAGRRLRGLSSGAADRRPRALRAGPDRDDAGRRPRGRRDPHGRPGPRQRRLDRGPARPRRSGSGAALGGDGGGRGGGKAKAKATPKASAKGGSPRKGGRRRNAAPRRGRGR